MPSIAELALELEASGLLLKGDTGLTGPTGPAGPAGVAGAASGVGFSFASKTGNVVPINTTLGGTSSNLRKIDSVELSKTNDMFVYGYSHTTSGDLRLTLDGLNFFKVSNPAEVSRFALVDGKMLAVPTASSINVYERNRDDSMVDNWLTVPVLAVAKDMGIPVAMGNDVIGSVEETASTATNVLLYKSSTEFTNITLPSAGTWSLMAVRKVVSNNGFFFGLVFKNDTTSFVSISGNSVVAPVVVSGVLPSIPTSSRRMYRITDSMVIVCLNNTQYCVSNYTVDASGVVTLGAWTTLTLPVTSPAVNQWSNTNKVVAVAVGSQIFYTYDGTNWSEITGTPAGITSLTFTTAGLVVTAADGTYLISDSKNISKISDGTLTLNTFHKPYLDYIFVGGPEPTGRTFKFLAANAVFLGPRPIIRDTFYSAGTPTALPLAINRAVLGEPGVTADVTLPVSGYDGQRLDIVAVTAKTTLTVYVSSQLGTHTITNAGSVSSNIVVTLTAGGMVSFIFNEKASTWLRIF